MESSESSEASSESSASSTNSRNLRPYVYEFSDSLSPYYARDVTFAERSTLLDTPNGLGLLLASTFYDDRQESYDVLYKGIWGELSSPELAGVEAALKATADKSFSTALKQAIEIDMTDRKDVVSSSTQAVDEEHDDEAEIVRLANVGTNRTHQNKIAGTKRDRNESLDIADDTHVAPQTQELSEERRPFTEKLVESLSADEAMKCSILAEGQTPIKGSGKIFWARKKKCFMDIVLFPPSTECETQSVDLSTLSAIIEVGFDLVADKVAVDDLAIGSEYDAAVLAEFWWMKMDRASDHVNRKYRHASTDNKSVLLVVICISKNAPNEKRTFKFGVFLCTPSTPKPGRHELPFRILLLWRLSTTDSNEAAAAFGKVTVASVRHIQLRDREPSKFFEPLGLGCCRLGDKVWRCYDSRLRGSSRKPFLYLNGEREGTDEYFPTKNGSEVVAYADKNCSDSHFGNVTGKYGLYFLWRFEGKLLVVETQYMKGDHLAQYATDFFPLILHLYFWHEAGFVHGDIRAFNTLMDHSALEKVDWGLFGDNFDWHGFITLPSALRDAILAAGCFIDFDFGGRRGETTTYPKGYKQFLDDGRRRKEEGPVLPAHDWYALATLLFEIHEFDSFSLLEEMKLTLEEWHFIHQQGRKICRRMESVSNDATNIAEDMLIEILKFLLEARTRKVPIRASLHFGSCLKKSEE